MVQSLAVLLPVLGGLFLVHGTTASTGAAGDNSDAPRQAVKRQLSAYDQRSNRFHLINSRDSERAQICVDDCIDDYLEYREYVSR
jgi:hypothetical protein